MLQSIVTQISRMDKSQAKNIAQQFPDFRQIFTTTKKIFTMKKPKALKLDHTMSIKNMNINMKSMGEGVKQAGTGAVSMAGSIGTGTVRSVTNGVKSAGTEAVRLGKSAAATTVNATVNAAAITKNATMKSGAIGLNIGLSLLGRTVGVGALISHMPGAALPAYRALPWLLRHWKACFSLCIAALGAGLMLHSHLLAVQDEGRFGARVEAALEAAASNSSSSSSSNSTSSSSSTNAIMVEVQKLYGMLLLSSATTFLTLGQGLAVAVRLLLGPSSSRSSFRQAAPTR